MLLTGPDSHLQFRDKFGATQQLAFLSDITNGTTQTANQLANTTQCVTATQGFATGIQPDGTAVCSTDGSDLAFLNASNLTTGTVPVGA